MKRAAKTFKKYLIPHEGNDHRPHLLRLRTIAFVCMVAIIAEAAFVFSNSYITPRSKLFGILLVNALVDETNQNRTANALQGLHENSLLDAAAQEKANDMAAKGYFAHTSPDGVTPWNWFESVGYSFSYAGENLAVNFSDSQDVTNAWMNSPEHRANILNGNYTEIGMATAHGTYQGSPATFVVELFGAPAASPFAFMNEAAAAEIAAAQLAASSSTTPSTVTSTAPAPTPTPTTVAKPKPKPAPKPIVKAAPAVVAVNSSSATVPSAPISVAVKGAQTQSATGTEPASATAPSATPAPAGVQLIPVAQAAAAQQSNFIQRAASDPKRLANDFYLFLMVLFALAVGLNIFVKIKVQHPKLIFSGLLVIFVAGLCVILNQDLSLLHAAIL